MDKNNPAQPGATTTTTAPAAGGGGGMMAQADVEKLVAERVSAAVSPFLKQQQDQQQTASVRDRYIGERMKDVPEIYRSQLPQTADQTALAQAEQKIRDTYKADLAAAGIKAPNVGGSSAAPSSGAALSSLKGPDTRSPTQLIEAGLAKDKQR
jgi:hypothetical protein